MVKVEKVNVEKLAIRSEVLSVELADVKKIVVVLFKKYLERKGWESVSDLYSDLRFNVVIDGVNMVLSYYPSIIDYENVKLANDVESLFHIRENQIVRRDGSLYRFISSQDELIKRIIEVYDDYLDYPEFHPEKWMSEMADYPVDIQQVKGRVVKLTYRPIHCWEGDEFRGNDTTRCCAADGVVTAYSLYWKDIDYTAMQNLVNILLTDSTLFEVLKPQRVEVNLGKMKKFLDRNFDKFLNNIIEDIKTNPKSRYNGLVRKLTNYEKEPIISSDEDFVFKAGSLKSEINNYRFDYLTSYPYYKDVFEEKACKVLRNELVEKYNNLVDVNIDVYEVVIGKGWNTAYYYLYIPHKFANEEKLYVKPVGVNVGKVIGKGGSTIKEISNQIGKRLFIKR